MKRLGRIFWLICVFFVISLAVALSVARMVLPEMSQYKEQLETLAREQFNYDIRIGSLGASWKRFSPVLALNNVTIPAGSVSDETLNVREVHVSLDLFNSLRSLSWRTHRIELVGFHLSVYRTVTGQWSLTRIPPESSNPDALKYFLKQKHIGFEDATISWIDEQRSGLKRTIRNVKFNLVNKRKHRRFSFEADLPESLGEHALLIGDMTGHIDLLSWEGPLYFKGRQINIREIAEVILNKPVDYQARLDAEIWINRSQGKLNQISGDLLAKSVVLQSNSDHPYTIDEVGSRFIWWSSKRGWRLNVDKIIGVREEEQVFDNAALSSEMVFSENRLNAAISKLSIAELSQLAFQVPNLPESITGLLNNTRPQGQLSDIQIETVKLDTGEFPVYLKADFDNIIVDSWGKIPGFSGIHGTIDGNLQKGVISIHSQDGILSSPQLFRAPINFRIPDNEIHWQKYADRFSLLSSDFTIYTDDAELNTRFQLDWMEGEQSPWIDMQLSSNSLKLNKVPSYLPVGIMKPGLTKWFDRSFKKGQLHHINVVLQGIAKDFPFDSNEGVFQANLEIDDGILDYSKQWGRLESFKGSAVFDRRSMHINVDEGRILHSPIRSAIVSIKDYRKTVLDIDGHIVGRLPAMLAYVTRTPLNDRFGTAIRAIKTEGSADLGLSLSIPLRKLTDKKLQVKAVLEFENNRVSRREGEFDLSDIRGRVSFTENDYFANDVLAKFRGKPVTIDVINASKNNEAKIKIKGPLKILDHIQSFNWPLVDHFHGNTIWQLTLHVPTANNAENKTVWVDLQSDLTGITSSLPVPFSKSKDKTLPLMVTWVPDDLTQPVKIRYGSKADAILKLDTNGKLIAGEVKLYSKKPAVLPKDNEFHVSGHLPVGAPLQWIALFAKKNKSSETEKSIPLVFDISTDRLALTKYFVRFLKIKTEPNVPWRFTLSGVGAAGSLQLNFDDDDKVSRIVSDLKYLSIRSSDLVASTVWGLEKIDPDSIPDLSIQVGDMLWDGNELGELSIQSKHENGEFIVERFSVDSDALNMIATGVWSGHGVSQSTRINAEILDGELEGILRTFGNSDAIKGGQLTGKFVGGWSGSPAEFSFSGLNGELTLHSKNGRIVDADPGAGKLLGLLSLKSLPRRLFFDFSDLSKEGFSFDKIDGSFIFNDGSAFTNNLEISGPSADIMIAGRTGMISQDYDELVTVIPSITSSLPLAGAIAGGPAVGAIVLLAERVLGKQVDKMSKIEYQVTGSWDDPKYEKLVPESESLQEGGAYDNEDDYDE